MEALVRNRTDVEDLPSDRFVLANVHTTLVSLERIRQEMMREPRCCDWPNPGQLALMVKSCITRRCSLLKHAAGRARCHLQMTWSGSTLTRAARIIACRPVPGWEPF